MNNIKIFQDGLIKVYENERKEQIVDARELHKKLESKRDFSNWITDRLTKYDFVENIDFTTILLKSTGGRPRTEYALTLNTAKEIAMVENNEQGRKIRRYFIEVEKKARGMFEIPKTLPEALRKAAELAEQLEEQKPKVLFANSVETSKTSILIGEFAKILKQNGVDIGQNRLFEWLRNNNYLIKTGERKNTPTQNAMELGLFEIKERTLNNPDGSVRITRTTKLTRQGASILC